MPRKEGKLIIRCAWCKRTLGDKPPYGGKYDRDVTDGICDDCLNRYFPHHADKIRECLEVEKIEDDSFGRKELKCD